MKKVLDLFVLYQFVRRLTKPFNSWKAFQLGVIDKDGKYLIPKKKRSKEQISSLTPFDKLILNLKKMLSKVPGGSTKFATYTAALFLLREEANVMSNSDVMQLSEEFGEILEDGDGAPTNNMGSGNIAITPKKLLKGDKPLKRYLKIKKKKRLKND